MHMSDEYELGRKEVGMKSFKYIIYNIERHLFIHEWEISHETMISYNLSTNTPQFTQQRLSQSQTISIRYEHINNLNNNPSLG